MDFFLHIVVNTAIAYQFGRDDNSQRAFVLGGIVPDLDMFAAWIPFLIPQLYILQHRGFFHTVLLAPIIVSGLILSTKYLYKLNFIQRLDEPVRALSTDLNHHSLFWGVLGVFMHLMMDLISYNGIVLFYPFIDQRVTLNLISVIDPLVSVLSAVIVLRLIYNKMIESGTYAFSQFQKSTKMVSLLFVLLLTSYSFLQINTIITQSPISTKPEIIPIFRWVFTEEQNTISISLVNQLSQEVLRTYNYPSLTYNRTKWNAAAINAIVSQVKETLKYKQFKFELESEVYLAVNATFNEKENRWEVSFLDTFQDAQFRFYGFFGNPFLEFKTTIYLNSI